jgi:hypothetical protein
MPRKLLDRKRNADPHPLAILVAGVSTSADFLHFDFKTTN